MLTLDSSGAFAALDRNDPHHEEARNTIANDPGPLLMPVGILAEIGFMIEHRLGGKVLDAFLTDLEEGAFTPECGEDDLPRARELVARYADLPLGTADSLVVACAERHGGLVLSFDYRHLDVVAREGRIRLATASG